MTAAIKLHPSHPSHPAALGDLVAAFLAGRSAHTLDAYRRDLEDFARFLGAEDGEAAARLLVGCAPGQANAMALGYRANLRQRGLAPATVNRRLASLRAVVKFARTVGLVTWTLEVPAERGASYRDTQGPGLPAVRALLAHLGARSDAKGTRDRAILRLLVDLGLRVGEVVGLDLAHLDRERGTLEVLAKGQRQRARVSLPEPTRRALAAWLTVRGAQGGPLFLSLDRAGKGDGRLTTRGVRALVAALGAELGLHLHPHGFRHFAITEALEAAHRAGIAVEDVRQFSRHRDLQTLLVYRDQRRDVAGQLAGLVAAAVGG